MDTKKMSKTARDVQGCLRKAVRLEIKKKALLGRYVIVERNGKTRRILAKNAL